MKTIKLSIVAIAIASLGYAVATLIEGMSRPGVIEISEPSLDQHLLLKKWKLSHYQVLGVDYEPEEAEKKDYIHFLVDKTYTSISEGKFEKGEYKLDESIIILTNNIEKGKLKLTIKKLTEDKLEVVIDDPSDSDAKYVTIHFKN